MSFTHLATVPILRAFDEVMTRDFYLGWLGFTVDFEHRFAPGMPLYLGISRDGAQLHVSEHPGDGAVGIRVRLHISGVEALRAELAGRNAPYPLPQLDRPDWGFTELTVADPFHNRITFAERHPEKA